MESSQIQQLLVDAIPRLSNSNRNRYNKLFFFQHRMYSSWIVGLQTFTNTINHHYSFRAQHIYVFHLLITLIWCWWGARSQLSHENVNNSFNVQPLNYIQQMKQQWFDKYKAEEVQYQALKLKFNSTIPNDQSVP